MAAAAAPDDARLPVHSRSGGNTVHHVSPPSAVASPGGVVYREAKPSEKWFPWLLPAFVVANVVMFVITMYVNNCPKNSVSCVARFLGRLSFQPFGENPLLGPSSLTLEKMGALDVSRVVVRHEGWRLITCMWLHGGVFHLLANMLSLIIIGIRLEQEFGFGTFCHSSHFFGWANQRHALAGYTTISGKPKFKAYQRVLWLLSLILLVAGRLKLQQNIKSCEKLEPGIKIAMVHGWDDLATSGGGFERSLFMVPLPKLRPDFKMELQHTTCFVSGCADRGTIYFDVLKQR
ncbi:RHOMBOID-like 1 [Striga asiatica]|uniref:RHOMBOID-like protein n=1 Tax=Striga asiatica TaxID=4170 RepID=A0A5A7RJC4_STRAF|nr:RHOMBOID-like 1 [Striga asiatica]